MQFQADLTKFRPEFGGPMRQRCMIGLCGVFFFVSTAAFGDISHLKETVSHLTGLATQGRSSGSEGEAEARRYLLSQIETIAGVRPFRPFFESFEAPFQFYSPRLDVNAAALFIADESLKLGKDFLPFAVSAPAGWAGQPVTHVPCDLKKVFDASLSGKIVLVQESECNMVFSQERNLWDVLEYYQTLGVAGIVVVGKADKLFRDETMWPEALDPQLAARWQAQGRDPWEGVTGLRSAYFERMRALPFAAVYVTPEVGKRILLVPSISFSSGVRPDFVTGTNIVLQVPGTMEDNVLISAHYDSHGMRGGVSFPGADDNASGVAAVLEMLKEAVKTNRPAESRGLVVVFFSGEEWGLIGSRAFAATEGLGRSFVAALNFDSISRGDESKVYVLGVLPNPDLVSFAEENGQALGLSFSHEAEFAFFRGSDHFSLHLAGVPSIDVTTGRTPEMDSIKDSVELMNFGKLDRITEHFSRRVIELLGREHVSFATPRPEYAPFPEQGGSPLRHNLHVILDPAAGKLTARDQFGFNQRPGELRISRFARDIHVSYAGRPVAFALEASVGDVAILKPAFPTFSVGDAGFTVVTYTLEAPPREEPTDHGSTHVGDADEQPVIIGHEGVYLAPDGYWYPRVEGQRERFEVSVELPTGWHSITSGDQKGPDAWSIKQPSEPLYLVAGEYEVQQTMHRGVRLQTYFHKGLESHAPRYLDKMGQILDLYLDRYGFYPYSKFAVVSNFFSTGYGMPSFTLLDRNIVPFPFIVDISLGHEFAHNYWGNSLYVKPGQGNWCEGLTVLEADYLYEEMKGDDQAKDYRVTTLRDYQNLVNPRNAFALKDFVNRTSPSTRLIGYGKGMMFWSMLRDKVGPSVFLKGLRTIVSEKAFQYASYDDFRMVLETASGLDLKAFFDEWINRSDVPRLRVDGTVLRQEQELPYALNVGLRVIYEDGGVDTPYVEISKSTAQIPVRPGIAVRNILLDPDFRVMRAVSEGENPPTLNMLFGQERRITVSLVPNLAAGVREQMMAVAGSLPGSDEPISVEERAMGPQSFDASAVVFVAASRLSDMEPVFAVNKGISLVAGGISVDGQSVPLQDRLTVLACRAEGHSGKPILVIVMPDEVDPGSLAVLASKLVHYGKYSYLSFDFQGTKKLAGIWRTGSLKPN